MFYRSIALLLSAMFVVSPAIAQDSHVVDPEQLQELIDQHLKKEGQDRREIRQALRHEEVQKVAGRIGRISTERKQRLRLWTAPSFESSLPTH